MPLMAIASAGVNVSSDSQRASSARELPPPGDVVIEDADGLAVAFADPGDDNADPPVLLDWTPSARAVPVDFGLLSLRSAPLAAACSVAVSYGFRSLRSRCCFV